MKEYSTKPAAGAQKIETLGGDYALKWDDETQMNVNAHAALLSQFAKAGGFFDRLHGDTATAELFGVGRFMSCDSVRRNFASIPDGKALPWVWRENLRLLQDVVAEDYVADLDPTVKPLYGHQEGAEFGYNPQKPGRPSHCYHTLCIAKLRLTLAVVVHPGNETSGTHSRSMLAEYLEFVSAVKKPRLVRGDVSFGNESVIGDCEGADVRYLFKTKRSKAVRRAFRGLLSDAGAWRDSSDGWQCAERDVRLGSWEKARRMVFARRPAEKMPKRKKAPPQRKFTQLDIPGLELVEAGDEDYADGYERYALVTDLDMDARDVLPLYRERGDCENIFDEMKNQWGWSGFTAHSLKQTALFAGMAVVAANLWNVFTRLGDDGMHHEAATSRPLLQSCVARLSRHARQGIVTIYTATCEKAREIYRAISAFLSSISAASQLSVEERRQRIIAHAFRKYGTIRRLFPPRHRRPDDNVARLNRQSNGIIATSARQL
ncbi:MAG: transposase [Kiritimatiellae bacterium]|nr:transposase [Kiritimatiellia bacterium]